jgi:hypothetical protein
MSAFICSPTHIATVVVAGFRAADGMGIYCGPDMGYARDPQQVARQLMAENINSVQYRYPADTDGRRPGSTGTDEAMIEEAGQKTHNVSALSAVNALKLLACLEYQSCETPSFEQSAAAYAIRSLRNYLVTALPEYREAPWSI